MPDQQSTPERDEMSAQNGQVAQADQEMPAENAPAEQQQQQQQPGMASMLKGFVVRMVILYMVVNFFRGRSSTSQQGNDSSTSMPSSNLFTKGMLMDMYVYLSESEIFKDFEKPEKLFWKQEALEYGDWVQGEAADGSFTHIGEIPITDFLQRNGSIFVHVYFTHHGKPPDPKVKGYSRRTTAHTTKILNKFKKKKYLKTHNLLTGQTEANAEHTKKVAEGTAMEILSHWHPNLTINIIDDHTPWRKGAVPQPLDEYITFTETGEYYPIIYVNDYWNLASEYVPINETTETLELSLTYSPMSLFKWQMYAAQGMRNKWSSVFSDVMGGDEEDEDQDTLKKALLDTNPYLLGLTVVVSIVHSIFEFLAFKNDIQFWNSRKSLEGLSVRSVFFNIFQTVIVLLYVLDNDTNPVVKISIFVGLGIEMWKLPKVVDISLDRENRLLGIVPKIRFSDKSSYTESSTKEYDQLAFKYLSWMLFPLLGAYAIYSITYQEHKGWYSWVLSMLYGFLITFGFIMMTPQLFINYKLKSVAHLPWRMLTYKALNTFIDDIFAFVIYMPTLYRVACFRDDIVFFVYLYQRYIYRVDPKRVNEFGVSQEDLENREAEKLQQQAGPKPIQDKKKD